MVGRMRAKLMAARIAQYEARLTAILELSKNINDTNRALFITQASSVVDMRAEYIELASAHEGAKLEIDENYDPDMSGISNFLDIADEIQTVLNAIREEQSQNQTRVNDTVRSEPATCRVKLEPIRIMNFDGSFENWVPFIQSFTDLIDKNDSLSNLQKVNYLVSHLVGSAKSIVAGIPPTEENYVTLLRTLKKRFEDNRALGHYYLDKLLNFKSISQESEKGLNSFLEGFVGAVAAIKKLKIGDLFDFFLLHIAGKKMDPETLRHFDMAFRNEEVPQFDSLVSFVQEQVKILARSKRSAQLPPISQSKGSGVNKNSLAFVAQQTNSRPQRDNKAHCCVCCKRSLKHSLDKCQAFLEMAPKRRYEFVKKNRHCYRCLSKSHFTRDCEVNLKCSQCDNSHNSLLHFVTKVQPSPSPSPSTSDVVSPPDATMSLTSMSNLKTSTLVLLATAQVKVLDRVGKPTVLRALLDGGSQSHFVTKSCCERLGLATRPWHSFVKCLGRDTVTIQEQVSFTFHSMVKQGVSYSINALVMDELTEHMPVVSINSKYLSHITPLELADQTFDDPGPIDLLIGAALWPLIVGTGKVEGPSANTPYALESSLGWLVMGSVPIALHCQTPSSFHVLVDEKPLDQLLEKFWSIEELSPTSNIDSEDIKCEQHFLDTVSRDSDGRIIVSLPFRMSPSLLGESLGSATRRFLALERRLLKTPDTHHHYSEVMKTYLEQGYMSLVSKDEISMDQPSYYIPHHGVAKVGSTSTPLRIVLDASAPTSTNISLNDLLFVGPKLQTDLVKILLNFRLFRVALTADIRQMYLRILMRPEDRRFQRLLWRFSPQEPIEVYHMNTVVFGISSSPFLALRSVQYLIELEGSKTPLASEFAARDLYMDDFLSSVDSDKEACTLQKELQRLLASGSFELTKWCSNSVEVMSQIPESIRSSSVLSFDGESMIKILGLVWSPADDKFSVQVNLPPETCTKRAILSAIARIFDPLGFLAPITVTAKGLIRKLWALGLEWDQTPPEIICDEWKKFVAELPLLMGWTIPRHSYIFPGEYTALVGFADASNIAYGAVVYALSLTSFGDSRVTLLCAKSKIAPAQTISVPRLELCAALLLSKLLRLVMDTYSPRQHINKIYAFTDSTVALQWISAPPSKWKVFVANRVTQIQDNVKPQNWFHVRGESNPADCLSRGLTAKSFIQHPLWLHGPPWLLQEDSSWPVTRVTELLTASRVPEEKVVVVLTALTPPDFVLSPLLTRVSSYRKLIRTSAYVLRALRQTRFRTGMLRAVELDQAEAIWFQRIQREHFSEIFAYLEAKSKKERQRVKPNSLIGRLDLFIRDGLIRVGGRLNNSDLAYDQRHPLLLPKKSAFTELLVDQYHVDNLHTGPHLLLSLLHLKYWILGARDLVRQRVYKCNLCFRAKPKPLQPKMSPLPTVRFQQSKAFVNCGVDYAGPLPISMARHRGNRPLKAYLCLFICLSTKAVHLELASSLSTQCFLAAFLRFLSRRGPCQVICSDQGTNFIGAKNSLDELYKFASSGSFNDSVRNTLSNRGIEWRLNPPSSPHFGGIWERSIRSVKTHLYKLIGNALLTYEELNTVLTQIEALLNSRPLCVLSADPNGPTALTPAHFLTLGPPLDHLPVADVTHIPASRLDHHQRVTSIVQGFWRRWQTEYLHTLQERAKWTEDIPSLNVGTVVIVMKENVPPLHWPLGIVEEICAGRDGVTRVAKIRTATSIMVRPLVKLCPLPLQ